MWWFIPLFILIHDAEQPYADWYDHLTRPDFPNSSCCQGNEDCHEVQWKIGKEGYEALVDGEWIKVPESKVLRNKNNPTGTAVFCYSKYTSPSGNTTFNMFCFIPASET